MKLPKSKPSIVSTNSQPNQLSLKINGQTVLPIKRKSTNDNEKENLPSPSPSIPNDITTFPYFKFKNHGNKKLKTNGAVACKYYICCQIGCSAKYQIIKMYDGKSMTKYIEEHNHAPPGNPKTKKEVKDRAQAAMGAGATPGNVHKQIVNNAPLPLSPADVPSLSQLKNWKYAMSVKDMPSGDVFYNINYKYNGTFLQLCDIASMRIVLASSFGLDILAASKYVIVDGTHGTGEQKVTLTTLLGFKEDVAIPCAYFLSKSKDTETYECFYETVRSKTKNVMSPLGVLLDFEEALAQGFEHVFPEAAVLNDFFHFVQANVRKIGQLGFKHHAKGVVASVNRVWHARTKDDFDKEAANLLAEWNALVPAYATYFRKNWLNRFKPEKWASFGRAADAPSGSAHAEAFHKRLTESMPASAMALDKLVDFLAQEDTYWQRVAATQQLWEAKKKQVTTAKERYAKNRRRLSHYLERDADPSRMSTESIDVVTLLEEEYETKNVDESVVDLVNPQPVLELPISSKNSRFSQCLTCKRIKTPSECSLRLCKSCCVQSSEACKMPYHKRDKMIIVNDDSSKILERIQEAVMDKKDMWISYDMGTNGKGPRKITPLNVAKNDKGYLINAVCHIANADRKFYAHRIVRVEDYDWSNLSLDTPFTTQTPLVAVPASVDEWLASLRLEKYLNVFKDNGYDLLRAFVGLDDPTLTVLGITMMGHRGILVREAAKLARHFG